MYKIILSTCAATALMMPTFSYAVNVKANKITCEDFVVLDETIRPRVVAFIEGANSAGQKEDLVLTVDQVSPVVATVVEECQKTPKATVWQKVENYMRSLKKKI